MLGRIVGGLALAAIDAGQTLVSDGPAAGRRVLLPWGGNDMDVNHLTADGLTIFRRALEWAAQMIDDHARLSEFFYQRLEARRITRFEMQLHRQIMLGCQLPKSS